MKKWTPLSCCWVWWPPSLLSSRHCLCSSVTRSRWPWPATKHTKLHAYSCSAKGMHLALSSSRSSNSIRWHPMGCSRHLQCLLLCPHVRSTRCLPICLRQAMSLMPPVQLPRAACCASQTCSRCWLSWCWTVLCKEPAPGAPSQAARRKARRSARPCF